MIAHQMTVAEAYRRRDEIERAGKAIYVKGYTAEDSVHKVLFHVNQPGDPWYEVWLVTRHSQYLVVMPARASVTVE
jgi:hypothetical protein